MTKRQSVTSHELLRRAFKYVARNTTLPFRVRHQAQLQLNQFPSSSRPVEVKERCIETGRGRGILTEFGLCRVSDELRVLHTSNKNGSLIFNSSFFLFLSINSDLKLEQES